MTSVGISTAHGRSITVVAIFAQTPSPVSFSVLKANLIFPTNTLWPRIASTAGNTMTEKSIATETANVPPIPRLGKPVPVKKSIPINPIATVTPLKKTALPAVATVIAVDVRISLPLFNSSRKRLTRKRE